MALINNKSFEADVKYAKKLQDDLSENLRGALKNALYTNHHIAIVGGTESGRHKIFITAITFPAKVGFGNVLITSDILKSFIYNFKPW